MRTAYGADWLREVVMGAQDNLTNVLAVVLGVAIGSGDLRAVALAGLAAALAEAISMGGVLYTATRAERDLRARSPLGSGEFPSPPGPVVAGLATSASALVAGIIPLLPFALLPMGWAAGTSVAVSLAALFALGTWKGAVTRTDPVRDGLRFLAVGGLAALAAALLGAILGQPVA
jgi:VIT1/CCC1 family predicted Fe2+/Mn2+ transporter